MRADLRRAIAVFLCIQCLAPLLPSRAEASDDVKLRWYVEMQIGQPSIWSLAQAHYLLAQVRQANQSLKTSLPDPSALDPNRANASQLDILRTLFTAEAQYDQSVGVKNQIELDKFKQKTERQSEAREELTRNQAALRQVNAELLTLQEQQAQLQKEDELADAERGKNPPTAADRRRKKKLAQLKVDIDAKSAEKANLEETNKSLQSTADADIATPNVTTAGPTATSPATAFPASDAFTDFVKQSVKTLGNPASVSASIALDNYVGMEYEIIAKQLTLLRDEVGPEERVVFLELPTSIYTADQWANGYMAQVAWKVNRFFDKEPDSAVKREVVCGTLQKEGKPSNVILKAVGEIEGESINWAEPQEGCLERERERYIVESIDKYIDKAAEGDKRTADAVSVEEKGRELKSPESWRANIQGLIEPRLKERNLSERAVDLSTRFAKYLKTDPEIEDKEGGYAAQELPISLDMIVRQREKDIAAEEANRKAVATGDLKSVGGSPDKCSGMAFCAKGDLRRQLVRTLEIIPRQASLNVNEFHATTKNVGLTGLFKWISGFGAQLDYEQQREHYSNFLQQEAFASGFGKGKANFGWIFGPLPGSERIAPGQRTTYAVLAVPKDALALELEADGMAFRRYRSPTEGTAIAREKFLVRIPGERTERLWIDGISYTPVESGQNVTAVLTGNYFSPQVGVMINGVPLKTVRSITRVGGADEVPRVPKAETEGEFEIPNSHEMVLSFNMPAGYVGTPVITLVTPERSVAINSLDLRVNFRYKREQLYETARTEPMFLKTFKVDQSLEEVASAADCGGFKLYRLTGDGLRPKADISVNNDVLKHRGSPWSFEAECKKGHDAAVGAKCTGKKEPEEAGFALQESTKSYLLLLKTPEGSSKLHVVYRQPNRQAFDEAAVDHDLPAGDPPLAHKIIHYSANGYGRGAGLDVSFKFRDDQADTPKISLAPREGICPEPAVKDENGAYRVHCHVNPGMDHSERDFVSLRVVATPKKKEEDDKLAAVDECVDKTKTTAAAAKAPPAVTKARSAATHSAKSEAGPITRFVDLPLPVQIRVDSVTNTKTGTPEGPASIETVAIVRGVNLQRASTVLFGDLASPVSGAEGHRLVVKVPKVDVAAGERKSVPISLQLGNDVLNTGLVFTYVGPKPASKGCEKGKCEGEK